MIQPAFLRYDPRFIEDCILLAVRRHPDEKLYHGERDCLYEIADPEERERAFQNHSRGWFMRLGLADPIEKAVRERPDLLSAIKYCLVARALERKEEGSELFVSSEEGLNDKGRRMGRILLRPDSLLDPCALLTFLRHELLHITDMLDPHFGYEPALPSSGTWPAHDRLLRERYRVLWDTTIDGRMHRLGWTLEKVRDERLGDFKCAFPMLGEHTVGAFRHFFEQGPHTHSELVGFACSPWALSTGFQIVPQPGSRCRLCGFPTFAFAAEPESMPVEVIAQIVQDFPQWHPSRGLCLQCADLYRECAV